MDLLAYYEKEKTASGAEARELLEKADTEGRALEADETAKIEAALENVKKYTRLAAEEKDKREIKDRMEILVQPLGEAEQTRVGSGVLTPPTDPYPTSIGDAFANSGGYKVLADRAKHNQLSKGLFTEPIVIPWPMRKAAGMPVLEGNNAGLFGNLSTTAGIYSNVMGLETPGFTEGFPPTIADLLPVIPVGTPGNTVTYPIVDAQDDMRDETTLTGSSWGIPEGQAKDAIGYSFTTATKVLHKLAGYTKFSTEFLEDAPALVAYINANLPLQIRRAEEVYLATALYDSVSDASPLTASGVNTTFDYIQAAVLAVQVAGHNPNGMIIAPADWAEMLVAKFVGAIPATATGYVGGGPFGTTSNPWGLRVVVSTAATSEHPLIGDFTKAAIYRKGGLSVQSTNTDQNDFILNLMTVRAEERLVLGKTYPDAFKTCDLAP